MKKEMLVNVIQPEESRIALVEDAVLQELYVERDSQESHVNNIFKGRVVNIEPSIQAAFVDFGVGRNGFLHVSDVDYEYYKHLVGNQPRDAFTDDNDDDDDDETPRSRNTRGNNKRSNGRRKKTNGDRTKNKPPIQEIFTRGSEVLVQVIKDGIGSKGPTLSTYVSIPGRFLVLMPSLQRVGISRKITDEPARRKLKQIMKELSPPEGLGFIVRTAGVERSAEDLKRDLNYLVRLWTVIVKRLKSHPGPCDIYQESDMIIRTIRDVYDTSIDAVWIDDEQQFKNAKEFMEIIMPSQADKIHHYKHAQPLFQEYQIEDEIARIQKRHVPIKGGGSIVIDQTEALVAIDVNSGTFRVDNNAEQTAFQVNLSAAEEIARQIRLRDLGGVIVNDFIDMREERHKRAVQKALRAAIKRDRARTKVLRISPFGLIEMTRQRIRPSLKRSVYEDCPCCDGTGMVKTDESVAIEAMRTLALCAYQEKVAHVKMEVHQRVGNYLANKKRKELTSLEDKSEANIDIQSRTDVNLEHLVVTVKDKFDAEIRIPGLETSNLIK